MVRKISARNRRSFFSYTLITLYNENIYILKSKSSINDEGNVFERRIDFLNKNSIPGCAIVINVLDIFQYLPFLKFLWRARYSKKEKRKMVKWSCLTHFMPLVFFYTPCKTTEKLWFSDVFRGYRKRPET